ncbi:MAG: hypothetical protein KDK91_03975 [Gammaproteobacteria bacterium]|nr:hypothetical protein [Gammaproteobacteria bacterium]
MARRRRGILALLIASLVAGAWVPAFAQRVPTVTDLDHRHTTARRQTAMPRHAGVLSLAQGGIGPDTAASVVQGRFGGRVLSVKPSGDSYAVKVLHSDGRVVVYRVDRQSGQIR